MSGMEEIIRGFLLLVIIGVFLGTAAEAQPIKAPAVITTPGIYELSEDARGITDIYGIEIQCSNVVIDGSGHFLGGEQREKSAGVYVNQYGGSITNVTVKNLLLEDWAEGVDYKYVKGQEGDSNLITGCDFVNSNVGIHIEYSDYVTVKDNQIRKCSSGVVIEEQSTYTQLSKNTIKDSGLGVGVTNSMHTTIEDNNINTCDIYGLQVVDSEYTTAKKNAVSDNKYAAMEFENSKNTVITGNNLSQTEVGAVLIIGNDVHYAEITDNYFASFENVVVDDVSTDISWNTTKTPGVNILGGPYLGGNYWGSAAGGKGFSDTATDKEGFGIADQPYKINDYNIDYLPLTHTTATKAPEEQISTPDTPRNESADNLTNVTELKPVQSPNSSVNSNLTPSPTTLVTEIPTVKETPLKERNVSTPENPESGKSVTSFVVVNQTHPKTNESIMNRSVANAYPPEGSNESQNILSPAGLSSDQRIPVSQINSSSVNPGSITNPNSSVGLVVTKNLTPSGAVGFLVFMASEPGGRVILTSTTGADIKLDPMQQSNLTVPVPVDGFEYTTYRVEKDGYSTASGKILPYPGPGQTTTIPVTLTRNSANATVQSRDLSPVRNQDTVADTIPSSVSLNQTPVLLVPVNQTNTNVPATNQSVSMESKNQPIVVTNGIQQTSSLSSHVIRASAGPGGAIIPEGAVSIDDKGSVAFMIEANEGRKIAYLVIDGIQTSPMSEYRFINVTGDHTIMAGFT